MYVVLLGSTVVLPCINRRKVWTDWSDEEDDQQVWALHPCGDFRWITQRWYGTDTCVHFCNGLQVVHWDRQAPGVGHDRADRLVDLYSSGEQRSYGSQFLQRKMNISSRAFMDGDFSLTVADLQVCDLAETLEYWNS